MFTPSRYGSLFSAFAILLFFTTPVHAASPVAADSTLMKRGSAQYLFVAQYVRTHQPETAWASLDEAVTFVNEVAQAWSDHVSTQTPAYRRLSTYVAMVATKHMLNQPLPNGATCAIWQHLAVPAFVADVKDLENESLPLEQRAFLLSTANLDWSISPSFDCELPLVQWQRLAHAVNQIPRLASYYLEAKAYQYAGQHLTADYRKEFKHVQSLAQRLRPLLEIQSSIYEDQHQQAFAHFAANIPNAGHQFRTYHKVAQRLLDHYQTSGATEQAFAVLDLLGQHNTSYALPRSKLRTMYEAVDPVQGPERYAAIKAATSRLLVESPTSLQLDDILFNVQTEQAFDTSSLKGRLILFDFAALPCTSCDTDIFRLNELAKKFGNDLIVVGITNGYRTGMSEDALTALYDEHQMNYPVLLDTAAAQLKERFGVTDWPTRFLMDSNGTLLMEPTEKRVQVSLNEVQTHLLER